MYRLVEQCEPLDLNSPYAYLLICTHFAATSLAAERNGSLVGFVSAYRKPDDPETLFVWQVAVGPEARGRGLAKRMITEILSRPECSGTRHVEATVNPSNSASKALFHGLARDFAAPIAESALFAEDAFGGEQHEEERLLRIGPFQRSKEKRP